jgi:hypothetical protein
MLGKCSTTDIHHNLFGILMRIALNFQIAYTVKAIFITLILAVWTGWYSRIPAWQVGNPEFQTQFHQKKKKSINFDNP